MWDVGHVTVLLGLVLWGRAAPRDYTRFVDILLDSLTTLRTGLTPHCPQGARGGSGPGAKPLLGTGYEQAGETMSERLSAVIEQPCVLCEETLEIWNVYIDNLRGIERIEKVGTDHQCPALADLVAERFRSTRNGRRAP